MKNSTNRTHQQQQQPQHHHAIDIEEQAPKSSSYSGGLDHRRISQHVELLKELTTAEKTSAANGNSSMNRSVSSVDLDLSGRPMKGLPLTNNNSNPKSPSASSSPDPKLIHPILLKVPLHIRFGINGVLSNVVFMLLYNWALVMFEDKIVASNIYAAVYLVFIPISHFMVSILVFGWPEHYCNSLLNNFPIGLTAIALGTALTAYLDSIEFSKRVDEYVIENFTFLKLTPRGEDEEAKSEFWSSLLVLAITSIWTYVLSIVVNQVPTKSEKKEL